MNPDRQQLIDSTYDILVQAQDHIRLEMLADMVRQGIPIPEAQRNLVNIACLLVAMEVERRRNL